MVTQFSLQAAAAKTRQPNRTCPLSPERRDEQLLATYAQTGSREAFEELVGLYQRGIYHYLCNCLGDAQLAEDASQNTFLQLHRKCRQFEPGRRLRPWLYTIAGNQAVDLLRRNRRHKAVSLNTVVGDAGADDQRRPLGDLLETNDVDSSQRLELNEDRERTRLAVQKIPAKARQVLVLVVYQGLPYRKAAETLGIPLGTVKSRMNKALRNLHAALIDAKQGAVQGNRYLGSSSAAGSPAS